MGLQEPVAMESSIIPLNSRIGLISVARTDQGENN
jgi:hypothetical protein